MLPTTTRKKLSHFRAHLSKQASKAARLEKRSHTVVETSSDYLGREEVGSSTCEQKTSVSRSGAKSKISSHTNPEDAGCSSSSRQGQTHETTDAPFICHSLSSDLIHAHTTDSSSVVASGHRVNNPAVSSSDTPSKSSRRDQASQNKSSKPGGHPIPEGQHKSNVNSSSLHHKNFKQKIVAMMKKFRSHADFDSEEQYREALQRELMKATAGRDQKAIEQLLKSDDLDVDAGSNSEADLDNISESSTPKPSLRPFFSSTTLDKI